MLVISGSFDDLPTGIGYLEEAAARGELHVHLWSDALVEQQTGRPPKFPQAEREYFLLAIRWVQAVSIIDRLDPAVGDGLNDGMLNCATPDNMALRVDAKPKKVVVTGCYDWLHTGHVRFFQEVSAYGEVYAIVGHDANIELLKGKGHPQFAQEQRRYLVGSLRYVKQALISTGDGWMDAAPEIDRIKPDMYAVNEDGDKPEKRAFCKDHGIEYLVLNRQPMQGLPARSSTALRGF